MYALTRQQKYSLTGICAGERSGDVTTQKRVYRTRAGASSDSRQPKVNKGRQAHGQVDAGL